MLPERMAAKKITKSKPRKDTKTMAKRNGNAGSKSNFSAKKSAGRTPSVDTSGAISTSFRNSPVPRNTPAPRSAAPREITQEMIAQRAYEIWQRGHGGSQDDHWHQAVRELNGR
jgi:hypothetical protein